MGTSVNNIFYIGSLGRTLPQKLGETPSVFDFGAVADGKTPCSAAFNRAAASMAGSGGGRMYVPRGVYNIDAPILWSETVNNCEFFGDGDATLLKNVNNVNYTSGQGMLNLFGTSITLRNMSLDGNVLTPQQVNYSTITDPMQSNLTQNSSIWIHGGSQNVRLYDITIQHSGGYAVIVDGRDFNTNQVIFRRLNLLNNRSFLFTLDGVTYGGSWAGGLIMVNNAAGALSNVLIEDSNFECLTGHAVWMHGYTTSVLNTNVKIRGCTFQDVGLDGVQLANLTGGEVSGNHFRRIGYISLTDNTVGTPAWCTVGGPNPNSIPAVAIDTAGIVTDVNYNDNTGVSINGICVSADGFGYGEIDGNHFRLPSSTDPEYGPDQIANCGPSNGIGQNWMQGIATGNSNNSAQGGNNVKISNNHIMNFGGGGILGYTARNSEISLNKIWHPANSKVNPIVLGTSTPPPLVTNTINLRAYNTSVFNNTIDWSPSPSASAPAIIEEANAGAPFLSSDVNYIYKNRVTSTTGVYGFGKDPNSGSTTSEIMYTVSAAWNGTNAFSATLMQREGVGVASVLNFYGVIFGGGSNGSKMTLADLAGQTVTKIMVTNPGSGYTSPTVSMSGGATAVAVLGSGGTAGQIVEIFITNPGSNYLSAPAVVISDPTGSGASATAYLNTSPVLAVAWNGTAGTGIINTGARSFAGYQDVIGTSIGYFDGFITMTDATYSDSFADSFRGGYCLLRFRTAVGVPEYSCTFNTNGTRIWQTFGSGGGGGGGNPGGVQYSIQWNSGGGTPVFNGNAYFEWNDSYPGLVIGNSASTTNPGVIQFASNAFYFGTNVYYVTSTNTWTQSDTSYESMYMRSAVTNSGSGVIDFWHIAAGGGGVGTPGTQLAQLNQKGNWGFGPGISASATAGVYLTIVGSSGLPAINIGTAGYVYSADGFQSNSTSAIALYAPLGGLTTGTGDFNFNAVANNAFNVVTVHTGGINVTGFTTTTGDGLTIFRSAHAGSARASIKLGANPNGWQLGQDSAVNGTNDFFLLDLNTVGNPMRLNIANNGNVGLNQPASVTAGQVLQVAGISGVATISNSGHGFIQSVDGFLTNASTYQAYQCPNGGYYGLTTNVTLYSAWTANAVGPAQPFGSIGSGQGAIGFKSGTTYWYWNATTLAWATIDFSVAAGGGAGPDKAIQYNKAGVQSGDANLEWDYTNQALNIVALNSSSPGIQVTTGFVSAANGFSTTSTAGNAVNVPSGGVTALTGTFGPTLGSTALNQVNIQSGGITCGNMNGPVLSAVTLLPPNPASTSSLRTAITFANRWILGQDKAATGVVDFFLYNSGGVFPLWINAAGNVGMNATPTSGVALVVGASLGYVQADGGYLTNYSGNVAFHAPNGGFTGKVTEYLPTAGTPSFTPVPGDGAIAYQGTSSYWIYEGSGLGWNTFNFATSNIGATSTQIVFMNSSNKPVGSSSLTWNSSTNVLTVFGASASSAALAISVGGLQISGSSTSDFGLAVYSSNANAIHAVNGGIAAALNITAGATQGFFCGTTQVITGPGVFIGTGINISANVVCNGVISSGGIQAAGFNTPTGTGQSKTLNFPGGFTVSGVAGTFHNAIYSGGSFVSWS